MSQEQWKRAVVIGTSGGIGSALVERLSARGSLVHGLSRAAISPADRIELADEASIAAAAARIGRDGPVDLVLVASGLLHGEGLEPEKSLRDLSPEAFARAFAVNATGPVLVAKHFLPLLPRRGRAAFAALSARVGSITDNRLGGWYSYRASKAALNMLIKTLAIELARTRPEAVCVGLHPGTVATGLSKPFQKGVNADKLFTPAYSANQLLGVLDRLTPAESGGLFAWDGEAIAP